jgi:hypothetical protein
MKTLKAYFFLSVEGEQRECPHPLSNRARFIILGNATWLSCLQKAGPSLYIGSLFGSLKFYGRCPTLIMKRTNAHYPNQKEGGIFAYMMPSFARSMIEREEIGRPTYYIAGVGAPGNLLQSRVGPRYRTSFAGASLAPFP